MSFGGRRPRRRREARVHPPEQAKKWLRDGQIFAAISEGRTRAEARENVLDALQVVLTPDEEFTGGGQRAEDDSDSLTLTYAASSDAILSATYATMAAAS